MVTPGKSGRSCVEHLPDVHPAAARRSQPRPLDVLHVPLGHPPCPEKKTRRYLPICTSSESFSITLSMRSRLT